MVFDGLFLDAAGTLFELSEPVGHSYARIAASHGLTLDPHSLEAAFRRAWKATPQPLHPEGRIPPDDDRSWWLAVVTATLQSTAGTPLPPKVIAPLFDDLYQHFAQPHAWKLFPDVLTALEQLAQIAPLHILSNFDLRLIPILEGLKIASYFQTITLSSQAGASKPHPRIYHHAPISKAPPRPVSTPSSSTVPTSPSPPSPKISSPMTIHACMPPPPEY